MTKRPSLIPIIKSLQKFYGQPKALKIKDPLELIGAQRLSAETAV
jgi:hypothetical protein